MPSIGRWVADRAYAMASAVSPRAARRAGGRLLRQKRLGEAEAVLATASMRFPRHPGLAARHALVAQQDGRFDDAAARWRKVCAMRPADAMAWCRAAECARLLGDFEAATEASGRAFALQPDDARVRLEMARAHDGAGRHEAALAIWPGLVERSPDDPIVRQGYAECLIRSGRLVEAEAQIAAGLRAHPGNRMLVAASGVLAMRRDDWEEAFAIWTGYVACHPEDELGKLYLYRVASVRRLAAAEAHAQPAQLRAPIEVERVDDEAIRELMLRFESIGSDCEFGTVQRRYGAEPLGLLRWNDVTVPTLAAALEARFASMGEPDTTELTVGEIGEIYVRDRRWDLGMHTFLFAHEVSREAIYPKMCRRVAWLRDKFLEDLAAAEKVFVFKSFALSFEELTHLHALLRGYGPARLLHVRMAVSAGMPPWPDGVPGTIVEIAPDLWVGYVERMGDLTDVPFDEWVAICRGLAERIDGPTGARAARLAPIDS